MSDSVSNAMEPRQIVTFTVGKQRYGIDVMQVQEVLNLQEVTPIPRSKAEISGLMNLRGNILATLDLRVIFESDTTTSSGNERNIIIKSGDELISLQVDSVGEVLDVDEEHFLPPPTSLPDSTKRIAKGLHKLQRELILELNISELTQKEQSSEREGV